MLESIVAIVAGVLASSSFIVQRRPESAQIIEKLVPYQGMIGVLVLFWSIRGVLSMDFGISSIVMIACQFIVGFLLSYGLVSKFLLSKNADAEEKGVALRSKLTEYQVPAGLALIVTGVLSILF